MLKTLCLTLLALAVFSGVARAQLDGSVMTGSVLRELAQAWS